MRIAICDDCKADRQTLMWYLGKYLGENYMDDAELAEYDNAEALLAGTNWPDILFLDIYMERLVDLIDLIEQIGLDGAEKMADSLREAIVYHKDTGNVRAASGLSVYFPYYDLNALNEMMAVYQEIDWSDDYIALTELFSSLRRNGQVMDGLFTAAIDDRPIGDNRINADTLLLVENAGQYVLSLTEAQWEMVENIQMNVLVDDGEGYIELGLDDAIEYTDDGSAIANFDYTWVALNGMTVPFYSGEYMESDERFRYTGTVPVMLNDQRVELVLAWDSEHQGGFVVGTRPVFFAG